MDLGPVIQAAGGALATDVTAGLLDVAPIALGVIAAFAAFKGILRAFRRIEALVEGRG